MYKDECVGLQRMNKLRVRGVGVCTWTRAQGERRR